MQKPFIIGVTGGSGSGKTFFIQSLAKQFNDKQIVVLSQDHYYKPQDTQLIDENGVHNFDLPSAIDHLKFLTDLRSLKRGSPVTITEYVFNRPDIQPKQLHFYPAPIIVVEGLFVQYFKEISQELDLKIFIETKDYLKLSRRIKRDNDERGYDFRDVLYRFQHHVMPVYETLIRPLKYECDLIIPNNNNFERALDLLTQALTMRLSGAPSRR